MTPQIQLQLDNIFIDTWNNLTLAESLEESQAILMEGKRQVAELITPVQVSDTTMLNNEQITTTK